MPDRPPGTLRLLTRPSMLLLHVLGVTAVVAAVLLGNWQLGAWQMHREDTAAELVDSDPLPLAEVLGPDDPFPGTAVGQRAEVAGTWRGDRTFYVADRDEGGRTGFWRVTPLETDQAVLPVVLGWTEAREDLPAPPEGPAEVVGWLQPGEGAGEADPDVTDDVLPTLRIATVSQRVDQDLYSAYLILQTPADDRAGLTAVTPASLPDPPTFTGLRNLLYGVEWWAFGAFAAFLWWRWTRDELAVLRRQHETTDDDGVSPVSEPAEEAGAGPGPRLPSRS